MGIKRDYQAVSVEGYQTLAKWQDKKPTRYVALYVRDPREQASVTLTIDEAKQVIEEIEKAIKDSKKKKNTPF